MARSNAGRPSKLKQEIIDVFKDVAESEILYCTDEELVMLVNDQLPKESKIDYSTFKNWKAGTQKDNPLYQEFLAVVKKALQKEKKNLLDKLQKDKQAWQRYAWILERKYTEWNLKHVQEIDHTTKGESINEISDNDLVNRINTIIAKSKEA